MGVMMRASVVPTVLLSASLSLAASAALAQDAPPAPPGVAPPAPPAPAAPPSAAQEPQPSPPPFPQPAPVAPPGVAQPAPPGQPVPGQGMPAQPVPQAPPSYYPQPPPPAYAYAPQPQRPSADQPRPDVSLWYGWQTLIAVAPFDIAMFAALAKYGDRGTVATFTTGFVGRNLAPAIVHMAHRRPGVGFGSIGLHAASTATGVAIGYAIGIALQEACPPRAPCRNGFRDMPPGPEYGAIAGSMVGTVLDVVILARRPRSTWSTTQTGSAVMVAPWASSTAGGLAAGGIF